MIKKIIETKQALEILGIPTKIQALEAGRDQFFKARGVRSINDTLPDDKGNVTVTTSSAITVKDEGSTLTSSPSSINFTGAGVTATAVGAAVTVDVPTTSPLTTKGDVYGFSSLNARIPVGSNDQVLTADSAQTLGVKWATPATGVLDVSTKTTSYTLTNSNDVVLVDTASGNITITLHSGASATKKAYYIKKIAVANTVTIANTSTETLDGFNTASYTLLRKDETLIVVPDGSNWRILNTFAVLTNTDSEKARLGMDADLVLTTTQITNNAGDFSPDDIAGLKLWLKGDAGTFQSDGGAAASADTDPVGEWEDQSGIGNHFAQTTAGSKPILKTGANGINSLPVVRFDGTDDYLEKASLAFTSNDFTAFFVLRRNGTGGGYGHIFSLGFTNYTNAGTDFLQIYTDASDKHHTNFAVGGLVCDDPTNMGTGAVMFTHKKDNAGGGTSALYRAGVSVDTGVGTEALTANGYGSIASWNSNDFNGDVAEIILYDTALSDANREAVEDYLTLRWGL